MTDYYLLRPARWYRQWRHRRRSGHIRHRVVVFNGLTDSQAIALEDMLATWRSLCGMGASRWCCFYVDGDGNFRPSITVNGRRPQPTKLLTKGEKWQNDEYRMDFDAIAWRLHEENDH